MKSLARLHLALLVAALLVAPLRAFAQTTPPAPSFEPSIRAISTGLSLNEEQAAKTREVLSRHAATIVELRQRAQRQPFSQKLQQDAQRLQQAIRDDLAVFLTDAQKPKLPRLDLQLAIPLPPGFVLIPLPPRPPAATAQAATEPLIALANDTGKPRAARLTADQKILHVLNRLTFGARPGDVERLRQIGVEKFISEQLNAEAIDDAELERRLAVLPTVQMSQQELYNFYPPAAVADQRYAQPNPQPIFGRPQQIYVELVQQKLARAVSSNRQLQEVMSDFWFNHFNVFAQKDAVQWMVTPYERDVIRPNAMGRFRDLLLAVAQSPAMLFYLDNWLSAAPDSRPPRPNPPRQNPGPATGAGSLPTPGASMEPSKTGQAQMEQANAASRPPAQPQAPVRRPGINENYARELLELHTLGVDGGYTQKDVQEVARCFTGWTLDRPYQGGGFLFRPWQHDNGAKTVLGVEIPAGGGISDGKRVIDILARHPATARFISRKLCQRFVADNPAPPLVERLAQVFLKSDGDIKTVLRALFNTPEFSAAVNFRAKVKAPLELAASAIRAVGGDTSGTPALHEWLRRCGEPLYQQQAPTGYGEDSGVWMNTGVFINRLNFGVALANNQIAQTTYAPAALVSPAALANRDALMRELTALIIHTELSAASRQAVRAALGEQNEKVEQLRQSVRGVTRPATAPPTSPTLTTADVQRRDPRHIAQLIGVLFGTTEFQKK